MSQLKEDPWKEKANRLINSLCFKAWEQANTKSNGKRYQKHHQYTVPEIAETLVQALGRNDEVTAKTIFLSYEGLQAVS